MHYRRCHCRTTATARLETPLLHSLLFPLHHTAIPPQHVFAKFCSILQKSILCKLYVCTLPPYSLSVTNPTKQQQLLLFPLLLLLLYHILPEYYKQPLLSLSLAQEKRAFRFPVCLPLGLYYEGQRVGTEGGGISDTPPNILTIFK